MFESVKKIENGGVCLNSGGGAATLGWLPPRRSG